MQGATGCNSFMGNFENFNKQCEKFTTHSAVAIYKT